MKEERFILIHLDKYVYKFSYLSQAKRYAIINCRGPFDFYIIVDLEKCEIVLKWRC